MEKTKLHLQGMVHSQEEVDYFIDHISDPYLTTKEINNKLFDTAVRGYSKSEV
ncbi:DivIVA domain-containing protein [Lactovum miscens]|uniref:Cell division septum initiation protein DivIVA n=1 Tax=Lactovum miscens TaxID=190387 RepID=A0A841C603_9LACT|nr:DivIVA domain-containing protein [Lactovum miscens]MBB5887875.1 cell division septum initiation protein DivIVA [Lactovum miscens]